MGGCFASGLLIPLGGLVKLGFYHDFGAWVQMLVKPLGNVAWRFSVATQLLTSSCIQLPNVSILVWKPNQNIGLRPWCNSYIVSDPPQVDWTDHAHHINTFRTSKGVTRFSAPGSHPEVWPRDVGLWDGPSNAPMPRGYQECGKTQGKNRETNKKP
jgi:hypothetical protein